MPLLIGHIFSHSPVEPNTSLALTDFLISGISQTDGALGKGWVKLRFRSKIPLSSADRNSSINQSPRKLIYAYDIHLKLSVHVLILAEDSLVVDGFLAAVVANNTISLRHTQVRVSDLINDLITSPRDLALTHVHGRVGGAVSLKTMSLWGDDLIRSPIFLELGKSLVGTQCGLKIKDEKKEALRITNEGLVSFYDDPWRLPGVEIVLGFLFTNNYFIDQ